MLYLKIANKLVDAALAAATKKVLSDTLGQQQHHNTTADHDQDMSNAQRAGGNKPIHYVDLKRLPNSIKTLRPNALPNEPVGFCFLIHFI